MLSLMLIDGIYVNKYDNKKSTGALSAKMDEIPPMVEISVETTAIVIELAKASIRESLFHAFQ